MRFILPSAAVPRPVFGTVRYLSQATLRKFDAQAYLGAVERLAAAEG